MSKIEVCEKLALIHGKYHVVGYVTLFHQKFSGHSNRYCFWEKDATQSEKESAVVHYLKIKPGVSVKKIVKEIDQAILSKNYTLILTHKVTNNSMNGENIHMHNWSDNKLLLLTNFDLLKDSFYFKTPIKLIKNKDVTIFKKLAAKYGQIANYYIASIVNDYNSLVTEIKNRKL